ncbi:MAG: hypothetical protein IPG71_13735 [bacterium]|nr:hypothetical protein [bacterium]
MKRTVVTLLAFFVCMCSSQLFAAEKPVQLSLVDPIQLFTSDESITGLRLNLIYGKNADVTGLDFGLGNHVTGKMQGIQYGFVNLAGDGGAGLQWGWVNVDKGGTFTGFQYGIYNETNQMVGLQLGLVNFAQSTNGLQLGLINIIKSGGWFPVFPIINGSL